MERTSPLQKFDEYIIDPVTKELTAAPQGLSVYHIPAEATSISSYALGDMAPTARKIYFSQNGNILATKSYMFPNFNCLEYIDFGNIKYLADFTYDPTKVERAPSKAITHLGANMYPVGQELIISQYITSLGDGFAEYDANLLSMEVFGKIENLPPKFIKHCKNLHTLILHDGIKSAAKDAFVGLNSLTTIYLPESFAGKLYITIDDLNIEESPHGSFYESAPAKLKQEKEALLTIVKFYHKLPFTFKIRKGDFLSFEFESESNGHCLFKRVTGEPIKYDLNTLNHRQAHRVGQNTIPNVSPSEEEKIRSGMSR